MIPNATSVVLVVCGVVVLSINFCGGHSLLRKGSSTTVSVTNKESSALEELETKLNLIIDTEPREQELLEDLLLKERLRSVVEDSSSSSASVSSNLAKGTNEEPEKNIITGKKKTKKNTTPALRLPQETGNNDDSSRISSAANDGGYVEEHDDDDADPVSRLRKEEEDLTEAKEYHGGNHNNGDDDDDRANKKKAKKKLKGNSQDSWLIVKKLEENSKRMESMVVFLADLRNVLSQAVASQQTQVALRSEVVELREEIEYLRQEVETLRKEEAHGEHLGISSGGSSSSSGTSKLDNKIHNDETTIAWLKESVEELRHGMEEISSSVNVTGMAHLQQQWSSELSRVHGDVKSVRIDLDSIKATQARQLESSVEIKGDIADIRTWQIKMGQKFLQEEQEKVIQNEDKRLSMKKDSDDMEIKTPAFLFPESTAKKGKRRVTRAHGTRHQRKLKSELTSLENVIRDVIKDEALLHKRLVKLEKKFASTVWMPAAAAGTTSGKSEGEETDDNNNDDTLSNNSIDTIAPLPATSQESQRGVSSSSSSSYYWNTKNRRGIENKRKIGEYGASTSFRVNALEKSLSDYANTLQDVNDKVDSLAHLRESTTQLFTALEALETKYDERLTEMQTGLSRMEASVSKASITNDELQEQQNLQTRVVRTLKKDFLSTRDQVNTNHLRLAAVQSQLLKWGLQTCTDLSKESIQNIKISSLESRLQALTLRT